MQREITASGEIVWLKAPVVGADGESTTRNMVRIGTFNLITNEPDAAYLLWSDAGQQVIELYRQPAGDYASQIGAYLESEEGVHPIGVDPTGGGLLSLLVQKPTIGERINQGGLVGYIIIALGALAMALAAYKLHDISTISMRVQAQRNDLDHPQDNNVLGQLLLVYQDNLHVDIETLEMRLHESLERSSIRVRRFAVFLGLIAAVAPLLGLLGTVVGMINTFQAITLYGTGDPQTMAGGISQALITTVLGLVVAVPAVLMYSIINGRCKMVINLLQQHCASLTGDQMQRKHPLWMKSSRAQLDFGPRPDPSPA
jgi:biopolymer transport protein ExbB